MYVAMNYIFYGFARTVEKYDHYLYMEKDLIIIIMPIARISASA